MKLGSKPPYKSSRAAKDGFEYCVLPTCGVALEEMPGNFRPPMSFACLYSFVGNLTAARGGGLRIGVT